MSQNIQLFFKNQLYSRIMALVLFLLCPHLEAEIENNQPSKTELLASQEQALSELNQETPEVMPKNVIETTTANKLDPAAALAKLELKANEKQNSKKETQRKLHEAAINFAANCHNNGNEFCFALSQGAEPMVNLLKTAHENDLRIDSFYSAFRILNNAGKNCEYIRDCALNNTLSNIAQFTEHYFDAGQEKKHQKQTYLEIEKIIYQQISQTGEAHLISPANFSSNLAKKVFKVAKNKLKASQVKEWQERLRGLLYSHLDHIISKTLWDTEDWPSIWESVLTSANGLYQMSNILEEADKFDDLLWHLVHRFVWFLEFSAGKLPREFYDNLQNNIQEGSAFFLELEELDKGIVSKKQLLLKAIKSIREKAFSNELFSQELPLQNATLVSAEPAPTESLVTPLLSLLEPELSKPAQNSLLTKTATDSAPKLAITSPEMLATATLAA